MIVVAIIAILAAIALPAYNEYRIRSAEGACQAEAKAFMNSAVAAAQSQMTARTSPGKACTSTHTVSAADVSNNVTKTFAPAAPGQDSTQCSSGSATCAQPGHTLSSNPLAESAESPSLERSEERRDGKECVRTCRSRWSREHKK